jgi:hypothetical protein
MDKEERRNKCDGWHNCIVTMKLRVLPERSEEDWEGPTLGDYIMKGTDNLLRQAVWRGLEKAELVQTQLSEEPERNDVLHDMAEECFAPMIKFTILSQELQNLSRAPPNMIAPTLRKYYK